MCGSKSMGEDRKMARSKMNAPGLEQHSPKDVSEAFCLWWELLDLGWQRV